MDIDFYSFDFFLLLCDRLYTCFTCVYIVSELLDFFFNQVFFVLIGPWHFCIGYRYLELTFTPFDILIL
jgi:hypothetical protein